MKKYILLFTGLFMSVFSGNQSNGVNNKSILSLSNLNNDKWTLVWNDEFEGKTLDNSKWSYWTDDNLWPQGNFVNEDGNLVDRVGFKIKHYYLQDNIRLQDGNLIITAKTEEDKFVNIDGIDRKILFSSGAIHTKDKYNVKEGKIEMMAAMPKGIGAWPAFWMWPEGFSSKKQSQAEGEIDIVEVYGDNLKKVTGTAHVLKSDNTYKSFVGNSKRLNSREDLTKYNKYSVEWDEEQIKWLFNDRVYKKIKMSEVEKYAENPFKKPYFLIINLALQNKTGDTKESLEAFPTEMKVDYVRVYKKK